MTLYTDLTTTILQAKCCVGVTASKLVNQGLNGEDTVCCEKEMMLLSFLIEIAEDYKCSNFDSSGSSITPTCPSLTEDEGKLLVAKMKALMK